jgi:hypothetical protein
VTIKGATADRVHRDAKVVALKDASFEVAEKILGRGDPHPVKCGIPSRVMRLMYTSCNDPDPPRCHVVLRDEDRGQVRDLLSEIVLRAYRKFIHKLGLIVYPTSADTVTLTAVALIYPFLTSRGF